MKRSVPVRAGQDHWRISRLPVANPHIEDSDHGDGALRAHALPGQAQHQRIELSVFQCHVRTARRRPDELALVQPARGQPQTHAVVHQNLQAVGTLVGKDLGVVWLGGAEGGDHPRQGGVGARTHVQRGRGQPGRIDSDHCSSSRSAWAHCAAAVTGQSIVTVVPWRWTSMWIASHMPLTGAGAGVTGSATRSCETTD